MTKFHYTTDYCNNMYIQCFIKKNTYCGAKSKRGVCNWWHIRWAASYYEYQLLINLLDQFGNERTLTTNTYKTLFYTRISPLAPSLNGSYACNSPTEPLLGRCTFRQFLLRFDLYSFEVYCSFETQINFVNKALNLILIANHVFLS